MKIITPSQCRAARALLNWSQPELAKRARMNKQTISNFESEKSTPSRTSLEKLSRTLENGGVVFTEDDGVKRALGLFQITLEGEDGVRAFFDDVYETTKETQKEILIFNGLPTELMKAAGEEWYQNHAARMQKLNIVSKNILKEGEKNLIGKSFASYKWVPKEFFRSKMIYVYGDKFAFMSFDPEILIKITKEPDIADSLRILINLACENVAREA